MANESTVAASVIIPTFNRFDSLLETLESLARQNWDANRFEVVIVDDGSSDETPQVANRTFPFTLRYVRQENQGGVTGRNLGARVATGKLLIFLDDDMTAEAGYVGALAAASDTAEKVVSRGQLLPWLPDMPSIFARIYAESIREAPITKDCESAPGLFASNNLAICRDEFWRLGGWIEAVVGEPGLKGGIWADLEFACRAMQSGLRLITVAGAKIRHRDHVIISLTAASERARRISKWAVPVLRTHPSLTGYLPMFVDKTPIEWKQDPPGLIVRKVVRMLASHPFMIKCMVLATHLVERTGNSPFLLKPLYRWIIGAHHYLGYRDGLHRFGVRNAPCLPDRL